MKILNNFASISTLLAIYLLSAGTVQAYPTDNGDYTTSGGLDWLDLTKTTNRVYYDVSNAILDVNNELYGWRYATGHQFDALMQDFGFNSDKRCGQYTSSPIFCHTFTENTTNINDVIRMLGDTMYEAYENSANQYYSVEEGKGLLRGILADKQYEQQEFYRYHYVAEIKDRELSDDSYYDPGLNETDSIYTYKYNLKDYYGDAYTGSFLVRDAVAQVPEPSTLPLLGLGIIGLGFVRRRRV